MGAHDWLKSRLYSWVDGRFDEEFHRKWKALPSAQNEYGYDPFGFNRDDAKVAVLFARFLYRDYFRADAFGLDKVPEGRVLFVSNHSGQLPFDGLCIASALLFDRNPPRMVRAMVERFTQTMPFVSYLFSRWGQIMGTPENCRRLLHDDEAILVFPEGAKGISKPFTQRYQLQNFGLGFMRLALETKSPIVPVAVVGAEEQAPAFNFKPLAKLLRSARANAENGGGKVDVDALVIKTLTVDQGPKMRRFMPRAMGRAYRVEKKTSHVYVELGTVGR